MSTVKVVIDTLRGRFHRYRHHRGIAACPQDYDALALEIGIAKATLHKFANGGSTNTESLNAIETWCDAEASKLGDN